MSPSPRGLALVTGRFRLLLLALFLAFGGTAVASGTRAERLVNAILLALVLVAAVLDLRERGHAGASAAWPRASSCSPSWT